MIGFKLDETTNDIVSSGGKITLLSTVQEAVRQRLDIKFNTFRGEWFLDTTYGIPYLQNIVGKAPPKSTIDAIYISEINNDPDVIKILYFDSLFETSTRKYSTDFEVKVNDQPLRVPNTVIDTDGVNYGSGDIPALQPSCELQYDIVSSTLYPFILEPEGLSSSSDVKEGGGISEPYEELISLGSTILTGGKVGSVVVNYEQIDPEELSFGSSVLVGGIVKSVVIEYDSTVFDTEELDLTSSILVGGNVTTVAIRYDSTTFDTEELDFTSAILAGGSVGI